MEVWFNPSCSTCRIARDELEEAGVEYTLRRYLDDPPSEAELRSALTALGPVEASRGAAPLKQGSRHHAAMVGRGSELQAGGTSSRRCPVT